MPGGTRGAGAAGGIVGWGAGVWAAAQPASMIVASNA